MISYAQSYPQPLVNKATRRGQYLTNRATQPLYLKYIVFNKDYKDKKRIKNIVVKNGIALFIMILTHNQPISAYASDPQVELYKLYAHMQVGNDKQYRCLVQLWHKESKWSPTADNKQSSAYGIPQLLKMTERNPYRQIDLGLKYIKHKHLTPCVALAHHKQRGWY